MTGSRAEGVCVGEVVRPRRSRSHDGWTLHADPWDSGAPTDNLVPAGSFSTSLRCPLDWYSETEPTKSAGQ